MTPRRDFIQTVLASVAVLGTGTAAQAQEEKPAEPQRIEERHTDFFKMMDEIAKHTKATGDQILAWDDPMPQDLGFIAIPFPHGKRPERSWVIHVPTDLKRSLDEAEAEGSAQRRPKYLKAVIFRQYLKSAEGRRTLAMVFPGQRR